MFSFFYQKTQLPAARRASGAFALATILIAAAAPAPTQAQTARVPAHAGADFEFQGEYAGTTANGDKLAAQVVALGEGRFNIALLPGGLPGAGWDGKTRTVLPAILSTDGQSVSVTIVPGNPNATADDVIRAGALNGKTADGKVFHLTKVERHSPTEGAKPPAGATVLFDGTSADQWENGQITEGNLLRWGTRSRKTFGDFKLHLEFRLPFMPNQRGQDRGNSGVKLQERYEIQVLDSFGLTGANNECGAVYTKTKPLVNMCFPPLSWQTYDIDFKAARYDAAGHKTADAIVSVLHNGVEVQHATDVAANTGVSKPEGPEPGALGLQDHGNPVVYRNVWLKPGG